MNWLYNFLPESYVHALGWTVVHSLWQGTLIAAAMMLTMLGLQRQSAAMRYRMAFGSLVLMLLVAFSTFCFLFKKTTDTAENDLLQALILRGLASAETVGETSFFQRMGLFFNQNLSIIVAVWLSGVVFFSMRLVGGLWFIRQLQSSRQYVFLESEWQMRVNYFKNRLGIRQAVVLAESVLVNVPMVVGWLKPLILLPIGTANAMSTAQVEAILAHELAHVAARDFLLNIVQSFIEIIFFYHPAAWWISAIVRTERENRCDDIAVQLCGNSLVYAKALLSLQEMQTSNARTFGLAMTLAGKSGGKRNGLLLNRIKRILKQPQNRSNIMEKLTATGLLLAVVTALSFGSNHFSQQNVSKTGHSVSALVKTTENDTTPRRDRRNMTATVEDEIDGKKVELKMKNNQITQLRIDGKEIPEADFPKYADLTDELLDNVPPPPPAPPMPPTFNAPTPPTPPTPPTFNVPAPPMPPTPPTPDATDAASCAP